ncbi:DUF1993 family protein [Dongia sp.]|uniref:DUF1993 domain-containing protein n=1 Tax=Dongia sp. TaxID=1977262 RepID=UPI0035B48B30
MSLSIYRASIPVLVRGLKNLSHLLTKGEAYAAAKGLPASALIEASLAPDMYNLARQVQLASDSAKGCGARLAGIENPSFADTETTFADLQARIEKTVAFLQSITEAQLDGADTRQVTMKLRSGEKHFVGADYLFNFVLPNFYFHVTTAYDILRHKGVELGKPDYLGAY